MKFPHYYSIKDLRIHHIFSYWIFTWFLVYYSSLFITSQENTFQPFLKVFHRYGNPSFGLWMGVLFDIFILGCFLYFGAKKVIIMNYIFINVIIKIIPLYLLRNHPLMLWNDAYMFLILLFVFNIYLWSIGTNIIQIYSDAFWNNIKGGSQTPIMGLLNKF
jgi:hypothetical protein